MNLTLHHFRKEVSHVRLRWLLWLALLALQMAVNLEWIAPMPPDFKWDHSLVNPFWLFLVRPLIWGVAFWLVVSSAPEDRPGNPDRFLGTRPLPVRCYFLGRVLAFLVIIVVPFAVQEALYLWLSERPWHEILLGAFEAAFQSCAVLGWWLPFSLLWQRTRELWAGVGAVVAGLFVVYLYVAVAINVSVGKLVYEPDLLPQDAQGMRHALQWPGWFLIATLILAGMAWAHLIRGWKLGLRLAAVVVLVAGTMLLIVLVSLPNPSLRPIAQAEVDRMAPGMHPAYTGYKLNRATLKSGTAYEVWMQGTTDGYPAEYSPHWRRQQVTLQHGGMTKETARSSAVSFSTALHPWSGIPVQNAFSSFFPKDTLWRTRQRGVIDRGVDAGTLEVPESWMQIPGPMSVKGKYAIDWLRWEREADLPAVTGSVATTAGAKWTVLSVDNHINHWGSRMSGMVCVTVRLEHQAQGFGTQPWDWTQEFAPVLYAPALGLVFASAWTGEGNVPQSPQAEVGARAQSTTWQRRIFRMAWADVLAPQGRVPEADAAKLRFVVLKRSYAGTSAWEGALPPMTLPKTKDSIELYGNSVLEDEAFLARLSELPKLKESATVDEARLYLADILETLQPIWRHPWENRLDLILERLEPLARMHPALLLQVGSEAPWPMILGRLATAPALRDAILTELPTTPWLGMVVGNRPDWQLLLREKAPLLMSAVPPRDGIFFSESFMAWRDPAHVPWLIQVMEAGLSTELYLYCRSFPEHREAADAAARRGARAAMLKAGPFVGEDNADRVRALALGLRAGLPETLDRVLHLARVSKPEERDVLLMFDWLTEAIGTTGDDIKSTGVQEKHQNWLSDIAALSAADFRFDEEARVWLRIEQPGTAPKTPAPTQR